MYKDQPLILSMDTATPCSSVALTRGTSADGGVVASLGLTGNVSHSRRLLGAVDYLMEATEIKWGDIDGIGVSLGPGSFTGLRIGMATAKGLATAAGKKMIGVSTLDALASRCVTDKLICSVLDARKKEVYAACYRVEGKGDFARVSEIAVLPPQELAQSFTEPTLMVGEGAVVYRELFRQLLGEKVSFAPSQLNEPSAAALGVLACEAMMRGEILDVGEAVPLYLRSSDAELNLLRKKEAAKKGGAPNDGSAGATSGGSLR